MKSLAVPAAAAVLAIDGPAAAVPPNPGELSPALQPSPNPGGVNQLQHKNRLQEYALRSGMAIPSYLTVNEGHQHAPKFRSTVIIDGWTFRSELTFSHRREAEQDAAKVALEALRKKIREECAFIVSQDTKFCKSILHEFAVKMNIEKPSYATSQSGVLLPVFLTSLVFDGKTYMGDPGKNKKEAEQLAACAVILSILADSDASNVMSQIIKSKGKLYAAMHKTCQSCTTKSASMASIKVADNGSGNSSINLQINSANNEPCAQVIARQAPTVAALQSSPPVYKMPGQDVEGSRQGCQCMESSSELHKLSGISCCIRSETNDKMLSVGPAEQLHDFENATYNSQGKRFSQNHAGLDSCKKARRDTQ